MKKKSDSLAITTPSPVTESHGLHAILLNLVLEIPVSTEGKSDDPRSAAQAIARSAALKSASVSGTLALPPGPLGWATILPDLVEVWRIQTRMVADIAAVHGRSAHLTKETVLFCLFKHGAAMLTRDLVVRAGKQFLVRRMTLLAFKLALRKIGGRLTRTVIEKTIARSIPLVGALAVGGYAYYDTSKVAAAAIDLFSGEIVIEEETPEKESSTQKAPGTTFKSATSMKKKVAAKSKKVAATLKQEVAPTSKREVAALPNKKVAALASPRKSASKKSARA